MSDPNKPLPAPGVTFSQRLWSHEVAAAEALQGEPRPKNVEPGYEFTGRDFNSGKGAAE